MGWSPPCSEPRSSSSARQPKSSCGLDAAVAAGQWGPAAENLNGFSDADIATRLAALNHDQLIWLYTAALGAMSGVSQRRILDPIGRQDIEAAYQACLRSTQWAELARVLNGFSDDDINTRLRALTIDQILALRSAAGSYPRLGPLIEIGSANLTNTTDTGNAYTSNAMILRNGVLITKDVRFDSSGTFGTGGFAALQGRVLAAVTS